MAAHQVNITDRAKRYRAQNNVTGPRKCVLCGSRSDLGVMHLTGNESHGEPANLAYGCRSCNGKLAAAFKRIGAGKPTNQYNPSKSGVPTFEQYMWAVSNHSRGAHDAGGAVIHATPKHKRIEYARRIVTKAQQTKRERLDDRWNPANPSQDFNDRDEAYAYAAELKRDGESGVTVKRESETRGGMVYDAYIVKWRARKGNPAKAVYFKRAIGSRVGLVRRDYDGQETVVFVGSARQVENEIKRAGHTVKSNPWPFSRPDARKTTPAHGGIAFHQAKSRKRADDANTEFLKKLPKAATFKGRAIKPTEGGSWVVPSIDKESEFDTLQDAKAFIKSWIRNPAKCKRNPASASAEVFEEFHGYRPSEVVTVTKRIHYHSQLAAAGKLTHLDVWGIDGKGHRISGFKGAFLAFNEAKNQLFVEGGDQAVNLDDFGIDSPHELESLGQLTDIGYQTNKTHLGDEGGEAVYVHKFRTTNDNGKHVTVRIARYPDLIYDVRNEQLLFSGGSYEILREGINK